MELVALALAPCFAIAGWVYHRDFDREPLRALILCFFLGVFSAIPAIALEMFWAAQGFKSGNLAETFFFAFVVVALSEELSKYVLLKNYVFKKSFFDEPFDGIVYAVMVSMGFAAIENVMYVLQGGVKVGVLRMFTAVPAHASFGILMGYFLGFSYLGKNKVLLRMTGLFAAVLFHGAYDFFLMLDPSEFEGVVIGQFSGAMISLFVGVFLSFRAIRIHRNRSPFKS